MRFNLTINLKSTARYPTGQVGYGIGDSGQRNSTPVSPPARRTSEVLPNANADAELRAAKFQVGANGIGGAKMVVQADLNDPGNMRCSRLQIETDEKRH